MASIVVFNAVLLSATVGAPRAAAITDGFYAASDDGPLMNVPLFDSLRSTLWPCQSDMARRNLSEVDTSTRNLDEDAGISIAAGSRGCQLINNSVQGTSWYGWMYPDTTYGVADFNGSGSGTGDPRHADLCHTPSPTSMGAGKVRLLGELEKPTTGLAFNASITLSAKVGQCVSESTLASYSIASISAQTSAATQAFDVTVAIPDGTRDLALTIRGGDPRDTGAGNGVYVHYLRMYASLGADAPDPSLPMLPAQLRGTGSGTYGNDPSRREAEPVNTATGNYVHQDTDLALPGLGLPVAVTRTYNSLDTDTGPLGVGWSFGYAMHLDAGSDGSLTFSAEDGAQYVFAPDGSGGFLRPAGTYTDLVQLEDGSYQLTRRDGVIDAFDSAGLLASQTDRNGNQLTFDYTSGRLTTITDTVGRTVSLGYDGSGRLSELDAPLSRSVTYTYDGSGRLETVTDLAGETTTYAYDTSSRLTTITDANGHVVVTNEYGTDGRVSAQTDANDNTSTFSWDPDTGTAAYTDAAGHAWADVYLGNVLLSHSDPLGNTTTYTYDANFNRASVTDPTGHTTTYTYDANSNLLSRTAPAPLSYEESWTYTALNDVASYTDGRDHTTTYTYDTAGNLTVVTQPGDIEADYGRDPNGTGLLVSTTDPRGKTTAYTYDADANLASVTSPTGDETTYAYDAAGRRISMVDPRGNASGADPGDYTTAYTYDDADRLTSVSDPLDHTTGYEYDPVGNRTSVTDPNDHTTAYAYDPANHLAGVTDAADETTCYEYDEVGNLVSRTDANDHTTTYAYDHANRLTGVTDPLDRSTAITYDGAGNPETRTDATGQTTTYTYDALNRVTAIDYEDTATPDVAFAYDANGNQTAMTDGGGTQTATFDDLDRLTGVTRGSDAFAYGYDDAGNLTSRTYPDATEVAYTYDDSGLMSSVTTDSATTTYAYDEAGNLTSIGLPNGVDESRTYDPVGRLSTIHAAGSAGTLTDLAYTYDPSGNISAVATAAANLSERASLASDGSQATGAGSSGASDAFSRTTSNGWGTAPVGGDWSIDYGSSSDFATDGSAATMTLPASTTDEMVLSDVSAADTVTSVQLATDKLAAGDSQVFFLYARRTDDNNWYRLGVAFHTDQTVSMAIARKVAGTQTTLVSQAITRETHAAGRVFNIVFSVVGSTLSAKIWQDGTSEPSSWDESETDTAITAAGANPLRGYVGSASNAPVTAAWDNLVISLRGSGSSGASDAFSRTTSNGWGTAPVGGDWSIDYGSSSDFATDGSAATMTLPASATDEMVLSDVSAADTVTSVQLATTSWLPVTPRSSSSTPGAPMTTTGTGWASPSTPTRPSRWPSPARWPAPRPPWSARRSPGRRTPPGGSSTSSSRWSAPPSPPRSGRTAPASRRAGTSPRRTPPSPPRGPIPCAAMSARPATPR